MEASEVDAIGTLLMKVRDARAECIVVEVGAIGPSHDCRNGNMLATVRVGQDTETAEAVGLNNAINLAKAKCARKVEARKEKAA